jgi:hypothetical protein
VGMIDEKSSPEVDGGIVVSPPETLPLAQPERPMTSAVGNATRAVNAARRREMIVITLPS